MITHSKFRYLGCNYLLLHMIFEITALSLSESNTTMALKLCHDVPSSSSPLFLSTPSSFNNPLLLHIYSPPNFISFSQQPLHCQAITTTTTSSSEKNQQKPSFTITYLINSCGLSLDTATTLSSKLQLPSPEKPDLVLSLLRKHGFSKTQISNLVRKRPSLLLANPQNTLLPKFEFLYSIGIQESVLTRTLSSDPTILTRSLENQLIPSYKFLKSVLLSNERVIAALKRTTWIFLEDHSKNLVPNVATLREFGVTQKCIALLLTHFPEAVMQRHDQFYEILQEVKDMGFDPQKSTFVLAVHAKAGKANKSIWDNCCRVYSKWGWSKDDISIAFKKHPHCMMLSEKKIMENMDFFVNKMGLSSRLIAHSPAVLFFSLEKRIIPRFSVLEVLLSKGLVKEDYSLCTLLLPAEKGFLERFVSRFEKEVPDLLSLYKEKLDMKKKKSTVNL